MANPAAVISTLVTLQGIGEASSRLQAYDTLSRKVAVGVDTLGVSSERTGKKLSGLGSKVKEAGETLTRHLTVPLGLVGGIAVKMASDYEMSVNKIATLSSGSAKDVAMLRNEVLKLGGETAKTPQELADALFLIESGGQHGAKAFDILKNSARASAVGLGSAADVAKGVTAALNAYAGSGLTASQATNTLGQAVKEGMVNVGDLVTAIGPLISTSGFMKVSFQSTMASVAALTRTGIDAATATHQLRMVFLGFLKPTKAVQDALHSVGLTGEEVRNSFQKVGVQKTFEMLFKAAGKGAKDTDAQKTKYAQFFQSISRGGTAALIAVGNNLKQNDKIAKDMSKNVDVIGKSFDQLRKQPGFQMQAGIQQVKNDLIILGEVILPIVAPAIVKMANAVQSALEWFHNLDPTVQKVLLGFIGFLAVIGPLIGLITSIVTVITALGEIMGAVLAVVFSPWIIAIGVIAAGAYLIIKNWSAIKEFLKPVFDWLSGAVALVQDIIKGLFGGNVQTAEGANWALNIMRIWSTVKESAVTAFKAVKEAISDAVSWVKTAWSDAYNYIAPTVSDLANIFTGAFTIIKAVITTFGPVVMAVLDPVIGVLKVVAQIVGTVFVHAFQVAVQLLGPIIDAMGNIISGGMDVIRGVIKIFAGLFQLDFGKMWKGVQLVFSGAWTMLSGVVSGGLDAIVILIKGAWNTFYSAGKYLLGGIASAFTDIANAILGTIHSFIQFIADIISALPFIPDIKVPSFTLGGGGGSSSAIPPGSSGLGHRTPGFYQGGMVHGPSYIAGEEGPRHPEVIIATNPAYRQRNIGLFAKAGEMLGVPGFAAGGSFVSSAGRPTLTQNQLAALWVSAGGAPSQAKLMAAIAMAESGGRDVVNSIGATGYWQIHPGGSQYLDPMTNARAAVSKLAGGGGIPTAWQAYTNGSYKSFLGGGGGGILGAVGGVLSDVLGFTLGGIKSALNAIPKPHLPKWLSGLPGYVLGKVVKGIEHGISNFFSGGGGTTGGLSPRVQGDVNFAQTHGWSGSVLSGFRTFAQQKAIYDSGKRPAAVPGTSMHERGLAVDVSDVAGFAHAMSLLSPNVRLYSGAAFGDPNHFSTTGHYMGGIYPAPVDKVVGSKSSSNVAGKKAIDAIWNKYRGRFPKGGTEPTVVMPATGISSKDPLYAGLEYAYSRPDLHAAFFMPQVMSWLLDPKSPYHGYAYKTVIHEFAHDFQNKATLAQEWLREGGASAFATELSPYRVSDTIYTAFKNRVIKQKGMNWIDYGQFAGKFAGGGVVSASKPTMAMFGENGPETAIFLPHYQTGGVHGSILGEAIIGHPNWFPGVRRNILDYPSTIGAIDNMPPVGMSTVVPALPSWEMAILGMTGLPNVSDAVPTTLGGVHKLEGKITGLTSKITGLQGKSSILDSFYSISPKDLVITNADGSGTIDVAAVHDRVNQLQGLQDIAQEIFDTYQFVVVYTNLVIEGYKNVIKALNERLDAFITAQDQLRKYKQNVEQVVLPALRASLRHISTTGLKGAALNSARTHQKNLRDEIAKYVGNAAIAQGGIGAIGSKMSTIRGNISSTQSSMNGTDIQSVISDRDNAWLDKLRVEGEKNGIMSGAMAQVAGMVANTPGGGGSTGGGPVTTPVTVTNWQEIYDKASQAQAGVIAHFPGLAAGGMARGFTMVGEQGPELATFPAGTRIYPNSQSTSMMSSPTIVVQVLDGAVNEDKIRVLAGDEAVRALNGATPAIVNSVNRAIGATVGVSRQTPSSPGRIASY